MEGIKIPVRKLDVNGATKGQYFEFPQLTQGGQSLVCDAEFSNKVLAKIEACVGVGIYSIQLTYNDGTTSPLFGGRMPNMEAFLRDLSNADSVSPAQIGGVDIQAWGENYV